jgi:hypothetical protein
MNTERIERLREWAHTAENAAGEVAPPDIDAVLDQAVVADLLWTWAETTHGNEFGHDHHCRLPSAYVRKKGAWMEDEGEPAEDPKVCTCGWSAFRLAYDQMAAQR